MGNEKNNLLADSPLECKSGAWSVNLALGLYVLVDTQHDRVLAEAQARDKALSLVRLVAEHTSATLQQVNIVLFHLHTSAHTDALHGALKHDRQQRAQVERLLAEDQHRVPGLINLMLADANGQILAAALKVPSDTTIADRRYFQTLKSQSDDALVISDLVQDRISKQWGLQIARRLTFPDGRFAGVLVASLGVDAYFTAFYRTLPLGQDAALALMDHELRLLVRYPQIEGVIGKHLSTPEVDALIAHGDTEIVTIADSPADQVRRLAAIRKLDYFPLYAIVALADDDYLAYWWGQLPRPKGRGL